MTSALDWSHDFCLSCDRQIVEGAYCSQACRLADLEKPGSSEGLEFSAAATAASTSSPISPSTHGNTAGFHLPPAVNFAAYKGTARLDTTSGAPQQPSAGYYGYYGQSSSAPANPTSPSTQRGLTTSSSRSSLSSISSTQSGQGLSPQVANELQGYVRSFDQVRDMKRRLTYV